MGKCVLFSLEWKNKRFALDGQDFAKAFSAAWAEPALISPSSLEPFQRQSFARNLNLDSHPLRNVASKR
jgi:hypothetical protein